MNRSIGKLFENSARTADQKILKVFFPGWQRKRAASKIFQLSRNLQIPAYTSTLIIPRYGGVNTTVNAISSYLESRSHPAITTAIVHGSIATGEEVAYSDFDGVLLIDLNRLENAYSIESLLLIIEKTAEMMKRQDALQHHGWMILTTEDLGSYPDDEIPLHLLQDGRIIYPSRDITLYFNESKSAVNYKKSFSALAESLLKKSENGTASRSFYHFKLWVSQLLLVPAIYFQSKDGVSIRKKESYTRLNELPGRAASFFREISELRKSWSQDEAVVSALKFRNNHASTPIPERYKKWVSPEKLNETTEVVKILLRAAEIRD